MQVKVPNIRTPKKSELRKIDNKGYALIKAKYNKEISNSQGFRTYLKLAKH
jgi:hypothetical protein